MNDLRQTCYSQYSLPAPLVVLLYPERPPLQSTPRSTRAWSFVPVGVGNRVGQGLRLCGGIVVAVGMDGS